VVEVVDMSVPFMPRWAVGGGADEAWGCRPGLGYADQGGWGASLCRWGGGPQPGLPGPLAGRGAEHAYGQPGASAAAGGWLACRRQPQPSADLLLSPGPFAGWRS
jgi:hypothetical protein